MTMPRRPLVAANWKMHFLAEDVRSWCRRFVESEPGGSTAQSVVFPSHPLLPVAAGALAGASVGLGGQDLHARPEGAHTGDVSGRQLVDAGCGWVLCGHSERRADHGEDDPAVAAKVDAAVRAGLTPVVCVGETGEERGAGRTEEVLARQLAAVLPRVPEDWVLAYEPVWAIGTGDTATPETAQEAHAFLRCQLETGLSAARAEALRILYGGSVKPANAAELIAQPDIDGFLVGGASLDPDKFSAILQTCD